MDDNDRRWRDLRNAPDLPTKPDERLVRQPRASYHDRAHQDDEPGEE